MENKAEEVNTFSLQEIESFLSLEGMVITDVMYHIWRNKIDPENVIDSLDYIDFIFENKYRVTLYAGLESDGIKVVELDLAKEQARIEEEFGDKIELLTFDVTNEEPWLDTQNLVLEKIQLEQLKNGLYHNQSLLLNFTSEAVEIRISPIEGLIVDYHEEV